MKIQRQKFSAALSGKSVCKGMVRCAWCLQGNEGCTDVEGQQPRSAIFTPDKEKILHEKI